MKHIFMFGDGQNIVFAFMNMWVREAEA